MSNNKATKRKASPMKKGANRQNYSSKKTSRVQLEGARQQNSGIGRQRGVAAAYSSSSKTNMPTVRATSNCCRIAHRELITAVNGSDLFTVQKRFFLNPGLSASFPWLSQTARCWEQFKFHSLKFIFLTRTGTTTVGSLMLAPDYDAADAAPQTEQIASTYRGVVEDVPWKDITCVLPHKDLNSSNGFRYVRSAPLGANLDIKTYDAGVMNVISQNGTDGSFWGKLWVEYDVEFKIPQLAPEFINPPNTAFVKSSTATISQARPLQVPVIEQTVETVIKSITDEVGFQRINFEKPFHGFLTYAANGTSGTYLNNLLNINPSAGSAVGLTEGAYTLNGNGPMAANNSAFYLAKTLVDIAPGGYLDVFFQNALAGSTIGSSMSLSPCYL